MATLKTLQNDNSVEQFINTIADVHKRMDCYTVLKLMQKITAETPKMWGSSIIGFGSYHYKYESGHEGDMCIAGFSPRKQNLTIYILPGFDRYESIMQKLGKYKTGKSCLYIKKLEDVNMDALSELIAISVAYMNKKYNSK